MAKATAQSRRALKDRTKMEKIMLALLVLIAYLLLASIFRWWPLNPQSYQLGTAFFISNRDNPNVTESSSSAKKASGGSSTGGSDDGGSNNGGSNDGGNDGGNNGGGGNGGGSSSGSSLLTFAAGVDTGNSKEEINGEASGLDRNCAIVVRSSTLGKQEVCTYREGDKLITVTFLNDRVISASRSGF